MRSINTSSRMFVRGGKVVPDGVSSPMRAFRQVGGHPICVASAAGATMTDVDGNVYVDFLNAFGAQLVGHAHPHVVDAICRQAHSGTVLGLTSPLEHQLAERIVASTPAIEQIRFVCSGTEAVMTATRIARAHTKRSLILKFRGSYHGHSDALLADPAISGAATKGSTHGIPVGLSRDVLTCHYNDVEGLSALFDEHGDAISAVLVEPFATNMGFVQPAPGFLGHIRDLCDRHGALFIMDEVVTGFRFTFGGVCNLLGITPDLMTFGKIIGGGTSIGAYAGKRHLMQHVAIGGSVFQSGTFAANPLTMAAGNATLDVLDEPGFYEGLEERGAVLQCAIKAEFAAKRIPFLFTRFGAIAGFAFRDSQQRLASYRDVKTQMYAVHAEVHARMLDLGFLMPPSLEEPIFISAAHSHEQLQRFAQALASEIGRSLEGDSATRENVASA